MTKTPAQAPGAGSHLLPPPVRHQAEGRKIKPQALQQCLCEGSGPNVAMQSPADITGIRWAANQGSRICASLLPRMGCHIPSDQCGVPGDAVGLRLLGHEQLWEGALGFEVPCVCCCKEEQECGTRHGTSVPLRARFLLLPFPVQDSHCRAGKGRTFLCLWGLVPRLRLSEGQMRKESFFHLQTGH